MKAEHDKQKRPYDLGNNADLQEKISKLEEQLDSLREKVSAKSNVINSLRQELFHKDVHIRNLNSILESRDQINKHLNERNRIGYGSDLEAYRAIRSSLSFRLGFALTFPLRWTYDNVLLRFGLIRSKSRNGISSGDKVRSKPVTMSLSKEGPLASSSGDSFGVLFFHIDEASTVNGKFLSIRGWAFSSCHIKRIEVWTDQDMLGEAVVNLNRPDVASSFPGLAQSANSGFIFGTEEIVYAPRLVKLRIYNSLNDFREQIVEIEEKISWHDISINGQYQKYLKLNAPSEADIRKKKEDESNFEFKPKISILTPVYNVDPKWLDACIKSVQNQIYHNWELCLYDDCSTKSSTRRCLEAWQDKDPRIKIRFGTVNCNISLATNKAAEMATGEFVGFLDHDDELSPDALYEVVRQLNLDSSIDLFYSDEDKIDESGRLSTPHFKSNFNLDLLRSQNYICHFTLIRKSLGDRLGWMRQGLEGAQDYDFVLRAAEITDKIFHIPKVLYHWRMISGSTASNFSVKDYVFEAGRKAIIDHFRRNQESVQVKKADGDGCYQVIRQINTEDKVSIIIPFKDKPELLEQCVNSILEKTKYPHYEILLISNNSEEKETFATIEKLISKSERVRLFEYNIPFNYSRINNWAVHKGSGKLLLFLNNDTEVINVGWLSRMIEHIQREEVGAVGAKLLYPDRTIQHAGVVLGIGGVAGHVHKHLDDTDPGYFSRAHLIQFVSACTAACLLVKKNVFLNVGGFDETKFKVAFNDIDLCLKIRRAGSHIVYTPYARLYHYESKSRGFEDTPEKISRFKKEIERFQDKWQEVLESGDPFFSPHFSLKYEKITLDLENRKLV